MFTFARKNKGNAKDDNNESLETNDFNDLGIGCG